jgi:F-type H+-transporting ATPase subunit alpha
MFYAHSSLLERAGRLDRNGKCLTSVPVVHAANGDITAYLPTNVMSITDGQWILDMEIFRSGVRPAVSMGLSVTRAGGVGHNKRQKDLAARTLKILADYRQAEEFSHFGSELAAEAKRALATGKRIFEILTQSPTDTYSLTSQQLMFDIVLGLADGEELDINALKLNVHDAAKQITKDEDFDKVRDELKAKCLIHQAEKPEEKQPDEAAKPPETKPEDSKHDKGKNKDDKASKKEKETAGAAA